MVTWTAGIMFLLFACMHVRMWGILRQMGGPRVRQPPMKWPATAKSLRNTGIDYYTP
jgi:hypothetical protein